MGNEKTCGTCKWKHDASGSLHAMCGKMADTDDEDFKEEKSIAYTLGNHSYGARLMVSDAFGCNQWEPKQ